MPRNSQETARGKDSYSIQSVENALAILEVFCEEGEEVRISHLSEKLGMNKTSIFRLLATFEGRGFVERGKGSGRYRLGLSAFEMGQKLISRMGLLRKARPVMERLVRQCNEAVYMTVRRGDEVLFIDMVETCHQVKIIPLAGKRVPLTSSAAGMIFLAHAPPCAGNGRGKKAPTSLSSEEILTIRHRGFSLVEGGLSDDVISLATPVFGPDGEIAGALCMIGPAYRMTAERISDELLPPIKDAGITISSKLGYLGHYLTRENL